MTAQHTPSPVMDVITRDCPFCGEGPGLAYIIAGRYYVCCENDECKVNPQTSGDSLSEAWANWNCRAPEQAGHSPQPPQSAQPA